MSNLKQAFSKESQPPQVPASGQYPNANSNANANTSGTLSQKTPPPARQRLRLTQLEDVSYPVHYPIHEFPPGMEIDPAQAALVPARDQISSRKYATSVDERNFLTVYEFKINDQVIIWDYYTGYVHLTGIWKAIGNSKADIVRLLDTTPQLEPVLRRVRGGFLKIQGTWLPYDVTRELSLRVAYPIRFALVPLFGADFPSQCLKPFEPGYGQLMLSMRGTLKGSPKVQQQQQQPQAIQQPQHHHQMTAQLTAQPYMANPSFHAVASDTMLHQPMLLPRPHALMRQYSTPDFYIPSNGHPIPARRGSESEVLRSKRLSSTVGMGKTWRRRRSSNLQKQKLPISGSASLASESAVTESSSDDEDELRSPAPRRLSISLQDSRRFESAPKDLVDMLKATRSLQQLSMGRPFNGTMAADFEMSGRHYSWDGDSKLEVLEGSDPEKTVLPPLKSIFSDYLDDGDKDIMKFVST